MAANWNNPTLASTYSNFLTELKARDDDAATMLAAGTNIPTNTKKWNTGTLLFQNWNGASFDNLVLSIAGGGTGSATAADARTALSIGTMGVQGSGAVSITGGTITGVNLAASTITSGEIALNRGGTGASLALGAANTFLKVNNTGTGVEFGVVGSALTTLNATNISSGNLDILRMPTGGSWTLSSTLTVTTYGVVIGAATGGTQGAGTINATGLFVNGAAVLTTAPSGVPQNGIIMTTEASCPSGFTRVSALDGYYIMAAAAYSLVAGSLTTGNQNTSHAHDMGGSANTVTVDTNNDGSTTSATYLTGGTDNQNANHGHDYQPATVNILLCRKD